MKKTHLLNSFEEIILSILIIVVPVTYLPLFYNAIDLPRSIILSMGAMILLFVAWIRFLIHRSISFQLSLVTIFTGSLTILSGFSLLIHSGNNISSILHPFGFITMVSLFIIGTSLVSYLQKREQKKHFIYMFLASSIVSGLLSLCWIICQFLSIPGFFELHPSGTLRASLVTQWIPFLLCLGILISHRSKPKQLLFLAGTVTAGILASISLLLYIGKFQPVTMPYTTGWQVALEALKTKPIQGAGILNYEHVFTQARPSSLNSSPLWNIRFIVAPNVLFHYITIFGFIGGLVCVTWLVLLAFHAWKAKQGYLFSVLGLLLFFLLFPLDITFLFAGILLSALITPLYHQRTLHIKRPIVLLGLTMAIPSLLLTGLIFLYIPAVQSEIITKKVVVLAGEKNFNSSIELLSKARDLTPYRDDLYVLSSQVEFNRLYEKLQENGITEERKEELAQDFNSVIVLAQRAVALNPLSSINWKNLADIYTQFRPYISNANTWAEQSLQQSLTRDPTNAFTLAQLADIYYSNGDIVRSIQTIEQANQLRPDYPPFLYALAKLFIEMKKYEEAKQVLTRIKEFIPASSPDLEILNADIASIEKLLSENSDSSQTITTPANTPSLQPTPQPTQKTQPTPTSAPTPTQQKTEVQSTEPFTDNSNPLTPTPTLP